MNHGRAKAEAARLAAEKVGLSDEFAERIRKRLSRLFTESPTKPRPTLLQREAEIHLVELVRAFSMYANPLFGSEIRHLAKIYGELEELPSTGWLTSLCQRYPDVIRVRKARSSHKKDVLTNLLESVIQWSKSTGLRLSRLALSSHLVFNIDETRALPACKAETVVAAACLTQVQYEEALKSTLYTLVGCYAADGTTLFLLYIFKAKKSKKGLPLDFYAPTLTPIKVTRAALPVPVYVATAGAGYMNGQLWMETMKIFVDLVGHRQGLGRDKQAALYLDGCSSHKKQSTADLLTKNNISTIFFPPNTSHIVQPADGQIFHYYKPMAAKKVHEVNLKATLGDDMERHFGLIRSIESHSEAVSKEVVQAAFRSRGIFPFDEQKLFVNAYNACPQELLTAAPKSITTDAIHRRYIGELMAHMTSNAEAMRKVIAEQNKPILLESAPLWKPKPRASAKKTGAKPKATAAQIRREVEESSESEQSDDDDADADEIDFFVPRLARSVSSNQCSACGHQRLNGTVPLACFDCSKFWLCLECTTRNKALPAHMRECLRRFWNRRPKDPPPRSSGASSRMTQL